MVCLGLTHCEKCLSPLDDNQFGLCSSCESIYKEEVRKREEERVAAQQKRDFDNEVKKQVKIELAKLTKKIETITLQDMEDNKEELTGYWEDGIFHVLK